MQLQKTKPILIALLMAAFSSWPAHAAATYKEVGGVVVVEAEHFDSRTNAQDDDHKWVIVPDEALGVPSDYANARGGKYLQVQPDSGQNRNNPDARAAGPHADYKVQITTTGEYRMFLRAIGFDGASDSLYVSIVELATDAGGPGPNWYRKNPDPDSSDFATLNGDTGWDGNGGADAVSGDAGGDPMIWNISKPGIYTVQIHQREDAIGFDAFVLQLSSKPDPAQDILESTLATATPQPLAFSPTPGDGAKAAPFNSPVGGNFVNGTTTLDESSVKLTLDGATVAPTITKNGDVVTVSFQPATFFAPASVHSATIDWKDNTGASVNKAWSFTVQNYNSIPAAWAVTPDTSKPGFRVRVSQIAIGRFPGDANSIVNGERQLADGYIDPATSKPYANIADLSAAGADGFFVDADVINWNQDAPAAVGNFTENSTPPAIDEPIPGIPGEGGTDNIAAEILTYIELPAGLVRMGVNSDDGFVTSVSPGDPRDKFGTRLGFFDGGRGASDTTFNFVVEKAGVYAFRTSWWEGGGGANIEWFTVSAGKRILLNDTANGGLKTYREASGLRTPIARSVNPAPNSSNVAPDTDISVEIQEQAGAALTANSVKMKLDGADVNPTISKSGDVTTIKLASAGLLAPASLHTVDVTFGFGTPEATITRSWSFTVANYPTLPVALGTTLGSGKDDGFRVRTYQSEASTGPNDAGGERTLAGNNGPNIADLTGATGGIFTETGVINYNQDAPSEVGNFSTATGYEDKPIPGIPGTTGSTDNIAQEILAFLEFPTAGIWRMGVNSDDGFKVTVADKVDPAAVRLGIFDGGRGAADTIFVFNVQAPGVYPMRLIWYEQGGGANVEWFTLNQAGEKFLVNDTKAGAVKAFRARNNTPIPVTEKPVFTSIRHDGASLIIEWKGGGTFQSAGDVTGPWTDVAGAVSPRTVTPTGDRKFYRFKP